jgi:hypothetical protein
LLAPLLARNLRLGLRGRALAQLGLPLLLLLRPSGLLIERLELGIPARLLLAQLRFERLALGLRSPLGLRLLLQPLLDGRRLRRAQRLHRRGHAQAALAQQLVEPHAGILRRHHSQRLERSQRIAVRACLDGSLDLIPQGSGPLGRRRRGT